MGRKQIIPNFEYEKQLWADGKKLVAGVDEAGRGAFAGPLVAAAVVFGENASFYGIRKIRDSKITTQKDRETIYKYIKKDALFVTFSVIDPVDIDKFGVGQANILAFSRALDAIKKVDFALIDGRRFKGFNYDFRSIVKGERKSISIAAASIVAKVERDRLMVDLAKDYSRYGFDKHKGYGTKKHRDLIVQHGPCDMHRNSFLKGLFSGPSLDL